MALACTSCEAVSKHFLLEGEATGALNGLRGGNNIAGEKIETWFRRKRVQWARALLLC